MKYDGNYDGIIITVLNEDRDQRVELLMWNLFISECAIHFDFASFVSTNRPPLRAY